MESSQYSVGFYILELKHIIKEVGCHTASILSFMIEYSLRFILEATSGVYCDAVASGLGILTLKYLLIKLDFCSRFDYGNSKYQPTACTYLILTTAYLAGEIFMTG